MRKLSIALTLLGLLAAVVSAADQKDAKAPDKADKKDAKKTDDAAKENEAPTLKVGDAPPPLKVSKWLQGAAVRAFDPGKTYVVEFWATWCGPCIMMMPHLGELQAEYKDQGVTFIGFSAKDPRNTAEKVAEFVAKRGPKLGYTFAYGDDRDTYSAWMTAAHQNGIPCSFVIDAKGKIAYIGHPLFLGIVLPKVIAGTWNPEHGALEMANAEKELDAVSEKLADANPETGLKAISEFEQKRPELAKLPFFVGPKIMLLIKAKKTDEAKTYADAVLAKAIDQEDTGALRTVASIGQLPGAKEQKALLDDSLQAADAILKISGGKDLGALITALQANFAAGNNAKAKELAQKTRAVAAGEPKVVQMRVDKLLEKFEDKKETGTKKETKKEDK
jgi:thiol-disulfide isomerase/thioredoxin